MITKEELLDRGFENRFDNCFYKGTQFRLESFTVELVRSGNYTVITDENGYTKPFKKDIDIETLDNILRLLGL